MPWFRVCRTPGCGGEAVHRGLCRGCRREEDRFYRRFSRREQGFYKSAAWQALRARKLALDPWCEHPGHGDEKVRATEVDHEDPISRGGERLPRLGELVSLCKGHHSQKTARETWS